MQLKRTLLLGMLATLPAMNAGSVTYHVPPVEGDATATLQAVIDAAIASGNHDAVIKLSPSTYNVYRTSSTPKLRHISNTTSERENPDNTKWIALYFKDADGLTLDGSGARIVTHGELTAFALEQCSDITLKNFTLDAADPSVPEFTVVDTGDSYATVRIIPPSRYEITPDSTFWWVGEGWKFTEGLAQVYFPDRKITWRYDNPIGRGTRAVEVEPGVVRLCYDGPRPFKKGEIYQMRHTIRNQVCGFINESSNVTLEGLNLCFIGNFGIVSQNSKDITVENCRFAPEEGSGRTCAGFADFLQFSGCRGHIAVRGSYFSGAHDDAINIHGTHLRVTGQPAPNRLTVRYMHDQTWGFNSFYPGDTVEIVNPHTLLGRTAGCVVGSKQLNDYEWLLTLDRSAGEIDLAEGYAVENVSATPSATITGNYFTLVPTRGILVTTRRKVLIDGNVFDRIPMPAIYVSDDARGWYESGPVRDLTVRGNRFIECGSPVVGVQPEIDRNDGPVHSGIKIVGNDFIMREGVAVRTAATSGVVVEGNRITGSHDPNPVQINM